MSEDDLNRWHRFSEKSPVGDEGAESDGMFIWGYRSGDKWKLGVAYFNVSGGWTDAGYGLSAGGATHWKRIGPPPQD